ncbi:MAG: (2Fe-2S) ferredoxin domain-containing protein [Deltaproteobacteria bacterium]|nr:MAG: (2Fe-2S) ferredoxin domain-containing protein [Deltaproteobacteria bacterium]
MASFYDRHIFCCINERDCEHPRGCCGRERGEAIRARLAQAIRRERIPGRLRANKAGCLDRCELGPCIVIYPDAVWYRIEEIERDVDEIVREHLVAGRVVDRLRLPDAEEGGP